MAMYKLDEFAKKIGVDKKTLQNWDRLGILVADRSPTNRRVYTDEHYKNYCDLLSSNEKTEDNNDTQEIKTKILIKKEEEDFVVQVKHLKTDEYIEINRLKTYKNARINAIKKKEEYGKIGIDATILKEIESI